jgi:hypothetical protein
MKPLGRALQLIENKKKEVFSKLQRVKMTDEELKNFCSCFLGDDAESFLLMCDKIEADEKGFVTRQRKVAALWSGYLGLKLMDLDFLKLVSDKIKEFKKKKQEKQQNSQAYHGTPQANT